MKIKKTLNRFKKHSTVQSLLQSTAGQYILRAIRKLTLFKSILILTTIFFLLLIIWIFQLDQTIQLSLKNKKITSSIDFYAQPQKLISGQKINLSQFLQNLNRRGFRKRDFSQQLFSKDYTTIPKEECQNIIQADFTKQIEHCVIYQDDVRGDGFHQKIPPQLIIISNQEIILSTFSGSPLEQTSFAKLAPQMFAQYAEGRPILQTHTTLPKVPTQCLHAVLAIEDPKFLDHQGISIKGIFRAIITNLSANRAAQGGSTITQQLIKNYFLTHEKTIKRKVTEIIMALLFELRANKDQILETYLNIIYMGQNGPFALFGMESASNYYFSKPFNRLKLNECALLAAILNSPGRYNPFRHPERALKRRNRVLEKMFTHNFISLNQKTHSQTQSLSARQNSTKTIAAPYFVDAVREELRTLDFNTSEDLKIYTSVNLHKQEIAEKTLNQHLRSLESSRKWLKKNKEEKELILQGALISVDSSTRKIEALVGGRDFKKYPFNRAVKALRQVGSIMKPFVFLTAFNSLDSAGKYFTPLSFIDDSPFTHKFDRQTWSPKNYNKSFYGKIPLYFALKNSVNVSTAKLGLAIGLEPIIKTARLLGIKSKIDPLPSMTLGAYPLTVLEVAEAYTTISRFGQHAPISTIRFIESSNGSLLFKKDFKLKEVTSPESSAQLVGILQEAIESGTGQLVRKLGFNLPSAGKTGTTSQFKDAWFSGFTPNTSTTVWVGYDNNSDHKLTGSSGALPIWANFMKNIHNSTISSSSPQDFSWPETTKKVEIPANTNFNSSSKPVHLILKSEFPLESLQF